MRKLSHAVLAMLVLAANAADGRAPDRRSEAPAKKHTGTQDRASGRDKTAAKPAAATSKPAATPAVSAPRPAAPPKPAAEPRPRVLDFRIEKATLDNGLRVVMNVDHSSPTIAVAVTYDVGSRNEDRGKSGFAHLFEHMMFEGSANVPKGEHFKLISGHGGTLNGTTSSDRTNYFEMLPANELPLALWLEADRMKSLDVSRENFENQRKVVQEEYRMRVSNVAYAPAQIRLSELTFQGYWPYEHDPIGSMQDLDNAELDWVRAFHDSYYAPNLAVLAIAGDFEPDDAMELVHRFFDTAHRQEKPVPYTPGALPEQSSPRSAALDDAHAKTAGFFYGWAAPAAREPDHYPLELAMSVLADGESSRLHQKLVRDRALAQEVSGWTEDHRGPDMAGLEVKLTEGARLGDVEKAVDAEIEALAHDGPTEAEMTKVRNRTEASFLFGLQSNLQRATKLGQYELFWGDARLLNTEPAKYFAVTRDDIKRVVARYLMPNQRSLVEVHPTGASAESEKPRAPAAAPPSRPKDPSPKGPSVAPPRPQGSKTDTVKSGGLRHHARASGAKERMGAQASGGRKSVDR